MEDGRGQRLDVTAKLGDEEVGWLVAVERRYAYDSVPTDRRYAEIREVEVERPFRRRSIASNMVFVALDWARRNGYTHVSVEASAKPDTPGRALYEREGFVARSVILDIGLSSSDPPA